MEFMNAGHRGAMAVAPENTLKSFMLAIDHGANELELDLRLSKDGALVVMHDPTVDRTTDGTGAVADLTVEQLRELDAGDGQPVPTFEDVLAATDLPLQVEIKSREAVEPLLGLLAERPDLLPRINPTSFDIEIVARMSARLPSAVVGLISKLASPEVLQQAETSGARRVLLGWSGTDHALIADAHRRQLHYGLWPVNMTEKFLEAVELGVDGITTDSPRIMHEAGYELRAGALVRTDE